MERISTGLNLFFILTTLLSVYQFYRVTNKSKTILLMLLLWMAIQFLLGSTSFYDNESTIPPRFVLLILPPVLGVFLLLATRKGRKVIDQFDYQKLTLIHFIRVPVEITLYYLALSKVIPTMMTFEGLNFDILVGLTAPIIYYFGFIKKTISTKFLLFWNCVGLGFLVNIVVIALLSSKTPLQQLAFDQPNIAVGHFPFNWLPSIIVPIVLLSHLVSIRKLIQTKKGS
jgi:hypothetical protein